jgi:hypothetical protein
MVKRSKYIPKKKPNTLAIFIKQKRLIEKHYTCFKCSVDRFGMSCTGYIQLYEDSPTYKVQIMYSSKGAPKVFIKDPEIKTDHRIHRYADESLCLYYPLEDPWKPQNNIHDTIIPWTAEWLVYYELFLVTEKWHGPQQPHDKTKIQENE